MHAPLLFLLPPDPHDPELGQATTENIAVKAWAVHQYLRSSAYRLKMLQPVGERSGKIDRQRFLALWQVWQQQARFEICQPGRHDQIIGGQLKADALRSRDKFEILLNQRQY